MKSHSAVGLRWVVYLCAQSCAVLSLCLLLLLPATRAFADGDVYPALLEGEAGAAGQADTVMVIAARETAAKDQETVKGDYGDVTEKEVGGPGPGEAKGARDEYGNITEAEAGEQKVEEPKVRDPLERFNRAMFKFNDRFYFWVMEPVTRGYRRAIPEEFRVLFSNFYKNVTSPIRIVNSLLQFKLPEAGLDLTRLVVNSTVGVGGLRDVGTCFGLKDHDEDFGQTLGFYGVGPGFYFVWPVLGPSTVRDSVGMGGDLLLNPMTYVSLYPAFGLRAHERVNGLSFHLGEYESFKKAAVDPYVAMRSAYYQNRQAAIAE